MLAFNAIVVISSLENVGPTDSCTDIGRNDVAQRRGIHIWQATRFKRREHPARNELLQLVLLTDGLESQCGPWGLNRSEPIH